MKFREKKKTNFKKAFVVKRRKNMQIRTKTTNLIRKLLKTDLDIVNSGQFGH